MEEVDCLIEALAEHINKDFLSGKLLEHEVAEETKQTGRRGRKSELRKAGYEIDRA